MLPLFWIFIITVLNTYIQLGGFKGVKIKMPEVVRAGSTVTLVCQFDMQGVPLYSVKWYRGNYEFYRYMPRERPPANAFPIAGLDVDLSGSNAHQVTLRAIPKYLSGPFTCEVSADAPSFSTASARANLTIIEMGIRRPILIVPSSVHHSNTPLKVNCSAQPTEPSPRISFFIDDTRVRSEYIRDMGPGLASLELLTPEWSGEGPRWIRCEASVPGVYHLSSNGVAIKHKEVLGDENSSACSEIIQFKDFLFLIIFVLHFLMMKKTNSI
ncbi:uncharacterized protein LOC142328926 isoform X2 [Lycorma delicatula]|uniref:uncharacterized protein LOC142328926 isoform X2 n=1 Tax=Lycorma delicatula TaxID=130591 RepID=UPI003F50FF5E